MVTSAPSGILEKKESLPEQHQQEQQQQQEGSFGCRPPLLQSSQMCVVDPSLAGSPATGGSDQRLRGERLDGQDAHGGGDAYRQGPSLPTDGNVWKISPLSVGLHEINTCSSNGDDGGKLCPVNGPPDRLGAAGTTVTANNDVRLADSAPTSTGITSTAENLAGGENGGRESSGGKTGANAEVGGKKTNKRSSTASPSPSSSLRSLEYLFFTGRRGGSAGFSRGAKRRRQGGGDRGAGGKHRGGAASDEALDGFSYERWQPDLLKLAEDGFSLPDWSEMDLGTEASDMALNAEESPFSGAAWTSGPTSQPETVDARTGAMRGKSPRGSEKEDNNPPSSPQSIVLSSHLSEADIPGMNGERAVAEAAADKKIDAEAVYAPSTSIGLRSGELVSPVCRVLVVKVYTGRSRRLPLVLSLGDRDGGTGGRGTVGGVLGPEVLQQAWAAGYKSVCVGGEDGEGEDAGGGDGSGEGSRCSPKNAPSRCQVS